MKKIQIRSGEGNALVVVDPLLDFANSGGRLYVAGVPGESKPREVRKYAILLCSLHPFPFDYLAVGEDLHPKGHIEFLTHPEHGLEETRGQRYFPGLGGLYELADERVFKGMDPNEIAYAMSTSPYWPFHLSRLRERKIRKVFLIGWAYTHCVGLSAIAYVQEGFETFVIRDATLSVPPPHGDPEKMREMLHDAEVREIYLRDIEFEQK